LSIHFFTEPPLDFELKKGEALSQWFQSVAHSEKQEIESLNYIFCTDDYLLEMNRAHLQHDYYTDVITFDNRENENEPISGDIFISYDRVLENAQTFSANPTNELHRVMVHGLLHLLGYMDKSESDQKIMREKEDEYLEQQ